MLSTTQSTAVLALAAVFLCCSIGPAQTQENIQLQIPPSLVECYNTSYFMNRDNRLPNTIETLITLIEKVENTYGYNGDIRQLAVSLLHRFRQDGIQRAPGVINSPGVIPYSPTGFQFPKFRILLSRLIPGNALNFPNSTLSREERCSLHFMLSSSFDTQVRGDENQVCNRLSQYRSQRLPRAAPSENRNNFIGDVELIENFKTQGRLAGAPQAGKQQMRFNTNSKSLDYDYGWTDNGGIGNNGGNDNSISQCPVENGVIWTPWGTVAAGTLIAGIAAGLQQQNVQLRTLLALSRRPGGPSLPQTATVNVDNRWAATIAGDLAEVALIQVPVSSTESASVGASGAWNSTVMPKWYFLSQRQNLQMTDAEIRGGLDGLILAMNVAQWRTQASNMKLSQLLRMYYSMNGVLGSGIMACNRKDNFPTFAPLSDMIPQTAAFAQVLDREMQLRVTLAPAAIANFATSASNALTQYVPSQLNDVSCSVSNGAQPQDISQSITPMTDIYVFLDTSWQYLNVVDYVNYVLQRININPYASKVTLLAAFDGSIIVNTTNYISDIYEQWNVTTHATFTPGFSLPTVLNTVQNLTQAYMNGQQANNSVGGRSMIALLIPYQTTINSGDASYSTTQFQYLTEQVPDLHFIYYAGGTVNNYAAYVHNPGQDLFPLNTGSNVAASAGPVVMRIKKIPRRIINPRCGSTWYTSTWGTDQMYQYAGPGITNFYRIKPNYFFGGGTGRFVNIQSQNSLQFTVCSSRTIVLPQNNATTMSGTGTSDVNCQQLTAGNTYSYDLSSSCNGYPTIHSCLPLYLSVSTNTGNGNNNNGNNNNGNNNNGNNNGNNNNGYNNNGNNGNNNYGGGQTVSCTDAACQTPNEARFTVSVVNLGCYSGVAGLFASFTTIALAFFLRQAL